MAELLTRLKAALGDRYAIEREVGTGGMATVFLARDLKHERRVALKVLKPELTAVLGPDRFPREIKIAAQLQHPHILPLHDSGEIEGFLYYVMPFVDGESLRAKLKREGPLPVGEAVRILKEVVDALAAAHAHGIVHRDIKPDNVMLSGRHAIVMDFGVAKAVTAAGGETLTTVGVAVGTPQYMAPEQAMGQGDIDHRADLYAVGILAYEMLTGEALFAGKSAQAVLSAHVIEAAPDVRERRGSVPAPLAEAVMRCLAKNPADRWQSAEALLRALETVAVTPSGGMTPTDTRPVKPTPARPLTRRRWLMGLAAAAVVVLGGLGGWFALGHRADHGIRRIAVLPIDDTSHKDSVFVDALHASLTNALQHYAAINVVSHTTMMTYRHSTKTATQIAKELNLDAVIDATFFRDRDTVHINAEFQIPTTARTLWVGEEDEDGNNVFAAQSQIAHAIAAGVAGALGLDSTAAHTGGGG